MHCTLTHTPVTKYLSILQRTLTDTLIRMETSHSGVQSKQSDPLLKVLESLKRGRKKSIWSLERHGGLNAPYVFILPEKGQVCVCVCALREKDMSFVWTQCGARKGVPGEEDCQRRWQYRRIETGRWCLSGVCMIQYISVKKWNEHHAKKRGREHKIWR